LAREATQAQLVTAACDDAALAERLARGESAAYGDLCDRFGPGLHGFAASRLAGDKDLADDVMVQTLTDAVRNIRRFNPRRSRLRSWVYGIARRKIGLERRRQRRRKSVPAAAQVPMEAASGMVVQGDIADISVARLDAERQAARIAALLTDIEMEVLILHCVDEFSVKEIAGIVGRSERAVDSLLHRARRKAREGLGHDDDR
jgi:RNA polymerase sigma factor (sigma-70 family)